VKKVITGNHAVSYGAKLARAQVIAAYPITPQTQIVELLSEMCANGDLDAKFIKVESEHSAMASCIGASAAGARAFTATSSQGLALMHELLHWIAGGRLPVVLANVNRAMGPPWSIYAEQTDSLSQRDTGLLQFYCESNQEVVDTVIQCFKVSEQLMLPSMLVLDAFFLSHTYEPVDLPEQDEVDEYLPPYQPEYFLDTKKSQSYGGLATPDTYYELRYKIQKAMERAPDVIREADKEFRERFGRGYGLVDPYRADDAETLLVTAGTLASTARETVDMLRVEGKRVGLLRIRTFRPFPTEDLRKAFRNVKKVAVIDRNVSFGASGIFYQETKAALYHDRELGHLPIFGFVAGLGGRDVTPEVIKEVYSHTEMNDYPAEEIEWIGVKR